MKVVWSALRTDRLYPQEIFFYRKNTSDTIWNRNPDLPAFSTVPQPNIAPLLELLSQGASPVDAVILCRGSVAGSSKIDLRLV
jgi:hypothetical protein